MAKAVDLVGQRFGKLVVVERAENNHRGNTQWLCKCDCGNEKIALGYDLTHGRTVSCGCKLVGTIAHNRQDITGQKFGKLTVLSIAETNKGKVKWKCRCSCGKETIVATGNLKNGHIQSCGCKRIQIFPKEDLVGQVYGRLKVESFAYKKSDKWYWKCKCLCGAIKYADGKCLKNGSLKSCGCLKDESIHSVVHGDSKKNAHYHRLYIEWCSMIERCNPSYKLHHRYYDRGIKVCDEWKEYLSFKEWALENNYLDILTLDRIDNNGDYEPSNCRWATQKQQANNKSTNILITYNGKTQTLAQWSDEFNINYGTLHSRLKRGWNVPNLFIPVEYKR